MHLTKFQLGSELDRKINLSLHLCPIDHANKVVIEGPPSCCFEELPQVL